MTYLKAFFITFERNTPTGMRVGSVDNWRYSIDKTATGAEAQIITSYSAQLNLDYFIRIQSA